MGFIVLFPVFFFCDMFILWNQLISCNLDVAINRMYGVFFSLCPDVASLNMDEVGFSVNGVPEMLFCIQCFFVVLISVVY